MADVIVNNSTDRYSFHRNNGETLSSEDIIGGNNQRGFLNEMYDKVLFKSSILSKSAYESILETNRQKFKGNGTINFGKTYNDSDDVNWGESYNGIQAIPITSNWSKNKFGFGNSKRFGLEGTPQLNILGDIFHLNGLGYLDDDNKHYFNGDILNIINLHEAPTVKTVCNDSTNLGFDSEQMDLFILSDYNRELFIDGGFDESEIKNPYIKINCDLAIEDNVLKFDVVKENETAYIDWYVPTIKGVRYTLKLDVSEMTDVTKLIIRNDYNNIRYVYNNQVLELEFEALNSVHTYETILRFEVHSDRDKKGHIAFDNISIKQMKEEVIVVESKLDSDTDIYEKAEMFQAVNDVSILEIVYAEYFDITIDDTHPFIHPFGLVQYNGEDILGSGKLREPTSDEMKNKDTYFLFNYGQSADEFVGLGYKWSELNDEERLKLVNDKKHHLYFDENDVLHQKVIRFKSVKSHPKVARYSVNTNTFASLGIGYVKAQGNLGINEYYGWNHDYSYYTKSIDSDKTFRMNGAWVSEALNTVAIPMFAIQRRNKGIYHPTYNPLGTALTYIDSDNTHQKWYEQNVISSIADCFDKDLISVVKYEDDDVTYDKLSEEEGKEEWKITGSIDSKLSGHKTGRHYDEINIRDIQDLRMNVNEIKFSDYKNFEDIDNVRGAELSTSCEVIFDNQKTLFAGSNEDTSATKYAIYVSSGTDDYALKIDGYYFRNFKENGVIYVIDNDTQKVYRFRAKNSYKFFRDIIDYEIKDYGTPFETDKYYNVTIIAETNTYELNNNEAVFTDVIGDFRKLKERVLYKTSNTDKVTITTNDYIYCDSKDNNNGEDSTYYRYIGSDTLTNMELDGADGNANESDGHIDLSDSDLWLNLGTNGDKGGFDFAWRKRFLGATSFYNDNEVKILPIQSTEFKISKSLKRNSSNVKEVLFQKRDGSLVEISNAYYTLNTDSADNKIVLTDDNLNDLKDLGEYNSVDEMKDLMLIIVNYTFKTRNMRNLMTPYHIYSDNVDLMATKYIYHDTPCHIFGVVGEGKYSDTSIVVSHNATITKNFDLDRFQTSGFTRFPIYTDNVTSILNAGYGRQGALKFLKMFIEKDNKLYLQILAKRLKYAGNNDWGDDDKFQFDDFTKNVNVTDTAGKLVQVRCCLVELPYFK